ncbi:MAG: beta-galactosidase trimerization domain-containing protein [Thermoproteota archaeon]
MVVKQWWHKPLTIADFVLPDAEEVLRINPAELAEAKSRLGFNTEHLGCSDVWGGEKGVFYFQTRIARQVPRDLLNEYLPEAHKRGIRVLVYYNVHWINPEFGRDHQDWLQVNAEGRIISDLYGSGNAPCVNSPWREWSLKGLEDMASYDIDGVFLDGPIFAPEACYCKNCREKFEQKYGLNLPGWEDWNDPAWRLFIDFRYESIAEYLREEKTLKKVRPNAIIYMNSTGLWPAWPAARDNRRLMPYQDILGAEGGFLYYDLRSESLWKPGMTAKLIEAQSGGKPTVVFIAGANKGWDEYLLTTAETRLLYADTIANGANPWYGISLALKNKPGAQAAGEMNRFLLANEEYLEGMVPLAMVGLFWSTRTTDFYRASVPVTDFTPQGEKLGRRAAGNFYAGFLGCYEMLVRSHTVFTILDEESLKPEVLHGYDLIIAPNCACISKSIVETIKEYVKNGGNLIASFECSRYDEYGGLLGELGLAEVFGVKVGRGVFGPMMLDYMSIVRNHPVAEGLSATLLPSPIYGLEVIPTTSEVIALFHEKMSARYVKLPSLSKNPAILMNNYGKGRCLYIAGNFFEHYNSYHNPDYRRITANAVRLMSRRLVTLENCPQSVEITLRYQHGKRRLVMHLVNFTGEMTRPIESIIPIRDLRISLHGFKSIRRAKALRLNMELALEYAGEDVAFKLPILREHEAIVLEPI